MAPKKRRGEEAPVDASTTSLRVTRSSTRRAGAKADDASAAPASPERPKKKAKKTEDIKQPAQVSDGSKTIVIEHW